MSLITHYANLSDERKELFLGAALNPGLREVLKAELNEVAMGMIAVVTDGKTDEEVGRDYKQLQMVLNILNDLDQSLDHAIKERELSREAKKSPKEGSHEQVPLRPDYT